MLRRSSRAPPKRTWLRRRRMLRSWWSCTYRRPWVRSVRVNFAPAGRAWTGTKPSPTRSPKPPRRSTNLEPTAAESRSRQQAYLRPGTWALFDGPYGRLSSRAGTQERYCSLAPELASPRCWLLRKDWSTHPVRRSCCRVTPQSSCSKVSWRPSCTPRSARCKPAGPAPHLDLGRRQAARGVSELITLQRWIPDIASAKCSSAAPHLDRRHETSAPRG